MKHRRSGTTLLELASVVTIVGLLLTISSGALHAVFRREATELAARRTRQSLLELSYRFRRDAALAESGSLTSKSCEWRLASGESIIYRVNANGVERERNFAGNSPQREIYALEGMQAEFLASPQQTRLVRFSVRKDPASLATFEIPHLTVLALLPAQVAASGQETSP